MHETRDQLLREADMFALSVPRRAALAPGGKLAFQGWDPVDIDSDVVAERIINAVDLIGAGRLVIDSIGELEQAIQRSGDADRIDDYLAALTVALRRRTVTAFVIKETPRLDASPLHIALDPISVFSETVLWLQQVTSGGKLHRLLSVAKMRFSAHDMRVHEFSITSPNGSAVLPRGPIDWDALDDHVAQQVRAEPWTGTTPLVGLGHIEGGERNSLRDDHE
ncbi:MAG TPA: ATPase domain-containing protein [Ktedonobacterales bacterium]|jgi:circadian clock protein KaiC|nr:ATPase domain-containing protein [Ktedonobacterales bacterium]